MTLVVDLPDSPKRELKTAADQHGLALSEYVLRLLTQWRMLKFEEQPESEQDRIDRVLAASGRVLLPHPTAPPEKTRQTPVSINGKPVSEIAIEQRG